MVTTTFGDPQQLAGSTGLPPVQGEDADDLRRVGVAVRRTSCQDLGETLGTLHARPHGLETHQRDDRSRVVLCHSLPSGGVHIGARHYIERQLEDRILVLRR